MDVPFLITTLRNEVGMYTSRVESVTPQWVKSGLTEAITVSYNRLVARSLKFGELYKMEYQSDQLNNEITIDSLVI